MRSAEPLDPDVVAAKLQQAGIAGGPADQGFPPDERERVRRAIADLPPEQRRALFLAAYAGRTAQEVSHIEGIPLGAAKTRIRTAMLRLHDSLESPYEVRGFELDRRGTWGGTIPVNLYQVVSVRLLGERPRGHPAGRPALASPVWTSKRPTSGRP